MTSQNSWAKRVSAELTTDHHGTSHVLHTSHVTSTTVTTETKPQSMSTHSSRSAVSAMHSVTTSNASMPWTESFDFDSWIATNRLTEIKHIFIDHDMCHRANLSMHYTKFPQFIASISMTKPVMVSKVVETLQKLELSQKAAANIKIQKIKATEEELSAEEAITSHLKALCALKARIHKLHQQWTSKMQNHQQQTHQIRVVEDDIASKFECISSSTLRHQEALTEELREFKMQCAESSKQIQSTLDELAALQSTMDSEQRHQETQLLRVQQLLESHNVDRRRRQHEVLEIGHDVGRRFDEHNLKFEAMMRCHAVIQSGDPQDAEKGNHQFMVALNTASFTKIMRHLLKFGKLKYRPFEDGNAVVPNHGDEALESPDTVDDTESETKTETKMDESVAAESMEMKTASDLHSESATNHNDHEYRQQIDLLKECVATKSKRIRSMEGVLAAKEKVIAALHRDFEANSNLNSPSFAASMESKQREIQRLQQELQCQRRYIESQNSKHLAMEKELSSEIEVKVEEIERLNLQNQQLIERVHSNSMSAGEDLEATVRGQRHRMSKMEHIIRSFGAQIESDKAVIESLRRRVAEHEAENEKLRAENEGKGSSPQSSSAAAWEEVTKWSAENEKLRADIAAQQSDHEAQRHSFSSKVASFEDAIGALTAKVAAKEEEVKSVRAAMLKQLKRVQRESEEKANKIKAMEQKKDMELALEYRKAKAEKKKKAKKKENTDSKTEKVAIPKSPELASKQKASKSKASKSRKGSKEDGKSSSASDGAAYVASGISWEQKNRQKRHQQIVKKLEIKFKKFNGREYIEEYCRVGGYDEPKVVTEYIGKNGKSRIARKAKETLWSCTIEIADANLKQVEHSKVRKSAAEMCYHNFASRISRGSIF